jgi:hypothetical protein
MFELLAWVEESDLITAGIPNPSGNPQQLWIKLRFFAITHPLASAESMA